MIIAFYKSKPKVFNKLVSWWTRGPYSHCEAKLSINLWASSSFLEKGIRIKSMLLEDDHWDFIDVPNVDITTAHTWYLEHLGQPYDIVGLLSVLTPVKEDKFKWFCSESVAASMGISESWRFDPNRLARVCEAMGGTWIKAAV